MKLRSVLREGYEAFVLPPEVRQQLGQRFPPKYPEWIGHHVTYRFGVPRDDHQPYGQQFEFAVVGYAETDGLEALVVEYRGSTSRPDGKIYHITWSLDRSKGWKTVDSNKVITKLGFAPVEPVWFNGTLEYLV